MKRLICLLKDHVMKRISDRCDYTGPSLEAVYTPRYRCDRCGKIEERVTGTGMYYAN